MTTEQTIPLNRLTASKANVRRTGKTEGINELAASIAAHGLRQNLNVLPSTDGKRFAVVAGGRRLKALQQLVKAGQLAKDAPIRCLVLAEGDDPAEISLAENAVRTAMHPDDQFEAFRALIEDKAVPVEEVAARFGVTPAVVRQRLKLANVSPKLRARYRKGELGLDHVMALAISDDHAAQEAAWDSLPDWNRDADALKAALTHDSVPSTDRLALFVGVEAYVAAGGSVVRDLFDDQATGYLSDSALLHRLATAKLEAALAPIRAEGWSWVKPELTRDYSIAYGRVYPAHDDEDEAETAPAFTAPAFTAADRARAGAMVTIDRDGQLRVERGLVDPAAVRAAAKAARGMKPGNSTGLSGALVTELTAHRTAALRVELSGKPALALAALAHALALPLLYGGGSDSCLDVRATSAALDRYTQATGDSPAHHAMAQQAAWWGEQLPGDPASLFVWCLDQPQERLIELLAYLAALTVDAVSVRAACADQLAAAVALDMRDWWTPSIEGFYQRLPKAALILAMSEAKVTAPAPLASVKKLEAAQLVAKAMQGSGWLPEPLRLAA